MNFYDYAKLKIAERIIKESQINPASFAMGASAANTMNMNLLAGLSLFKKKKQMKQKQAAKIRELVPKLEEIAKKLPKFPKRGNTKEEAKAIIKALLKGTKFDYSAPMYARNLGGSELTNYINEMASRSIPISVTFTPEEKAILKTLKRNLSGSELGNYINEATSSSIPTSINFTTKDKAILAALASSPLLVGAGAYGYSRRRKKARKR